MEHFWLEIIGTVIVAILGGLGLVKVYLSGRSRAKIWSMYRGLTKDMDGNMTEGPTANYGLPDITGERDGMRFYIHPVRANKGKKGHPPKTIYGVEHDLDLEGDVVITSPDTSSVEKELPELDIKSLKKYDYEAVTDDHRTEKAVKQIFTRKTASKFNRMVSRTGDGFRALILEPGVMMFSTYGIIVDKESMKDRLSDLLELAKDMEDNQDISGTTTASERIEKMNEQSSVVYLETGIMAALLAVSAYLFYSVLSTFSMFFLSLALIMSLIAGTRLISIFWTRGWM